MADQFQIDHAPGNRVITASRWPSLVTPPEHRPAWMPSPLALALHMTGEAPLEAEGSHLRLGKLMEPVGEACLREDYGMTLDAVQPRYERPDVPALCYPDGRAGDALVEFKYLLGGERQYVEQWSDGPPLHVRAQAQAQALISGLGRVYIVPIIIGYGVRIEMFEEPADPNVAEVLLDAVRQFMAILDRRELPAADATPSSYEALMRTLRIQPEKRVTLDSPETAAIVQAWRATRQERLDAEKIEEIAKRRLAADAGDASEIHLADGSVVRRTSVTRKADPNPKPQPESTYWRWSP